MALVVGSSVLEQSERNFRSFGFANFDCEEEEEICGVPLLFHY